MDACPGWAERRTAVSETREVSLELSNLETVWDVKIEARRLGDDTGRDVVLHLGSQIAQVHDHIRDARAGHTRFEESRV